MPNWSSNRLYVSGAPLKVKEFTDTLGGPDAHGRTEDFSFNQIVPMPPECLRTDLRSEDHQFPNWYDWSIENWGTKWDAAEVECDLEGIRKLVDSAVSDGDSEVTIDIGFDTAWSPPIQWMKTVGKKFPELKFEIAFSECGMSFYGVATVVGEEYTEECPENGCTWGEEGSDDEYQPVGDWADFLEYHSIGCGG